MCKAIAILTLILASCFLVEPTRAADIRCIDASKYKYLWQIFGNNQQKFAEFLKVSPLQLPAPEMCRAILITGPIGPPPDACRTARPPSMCADWAATKTSDVLREVDRDFDQLLNVIAMNNGWVAEIYLASPGGHAETGRTLGRLARTFGLKTVAVGNGFLEYVPDFVARTIAPPGSGQAITRTSELDWQAYSMATRGLSRIRLQSGHAQCGSACAFLLVGGVDRRGIPYVHREFVFRELQRPEVLPLPKGQEGFWHAVNLAYLQQMDAGVDIIRAAQSNKLIPARAPRFPSLISDLLISQCDVNVDELEKRETHIRAALTKAAAKGGNRAAAERLRNELTGVGRQRAKLEVCIATIHENKRLAQFAKYCSGRNCDRGAVREEIDRQVAAGTTRPLAEQGFATARNNLGVAYTNGQGVPQDYVEAAKWFRLAADQGDADAQYNLGVLYWSGQGVPRDYGEAAKWSRLAANQGHSIAQYALGVLYAHGLGGWPDFTEAAKWFRLAANQGHPDAQYNLGLFYTKGQGLPRDYVRAHMWLNLSATKGNQNAEKNRDAIAQHMSSKQIAEAEKLAREWKPTKRPP